MDAKPYLDAGEASAYLGVSRTTLYAYVSRGFLVSEPDPSSSTRARRYPRAALDELKAKREQRGDPELKALGALTAGLPVLESGLTAIAEGRLWYRGFDTIELSRTATFEQVACLLWTGSLEGSREVFPARTSPKRARSREPLADRLFAQLLAARAEPPVTLADAATPAFRAAARIVTQLFEAVGATGAGTLAERLARGWGKPGAAADIEAALVLCADHELNTSAFTARCIASTDAPVQNVLLGALCALEGRRHGGAIDRAEGLLREARQRGVERAWRRAVADDGRVHGFGAHHVYAGDDPRAAELVARLSLPGRAPSARVMALADTELGVRPNLDFALAALADAHSLPLGAGFALFALGRSAGWIAHAFEAAATGRLLRPRARYTGPPPHFDSVTKP